MTRWNPTNTLALSRWLTTRRTCQSPAEYACAVERMEPKSTNTPSERFMLVLAGAFLTAIFFGVI